MERHDPPREGTTATDPLPALGGTPSRREFVRKVGKFLFAAAVVDLGPGAQQANASVPACSTATPDGSCSYAENNADEHCGYGANHGDVDENCRVASQFAGADRDGNCNISLGTKDVDESCGAGGGANTDESCGDCDDNHDNDDNCGNANAAPAGAPGDIDQLCGHQHWDAGSIDFDGNCSATFADQGCGVHNTSYGGNDTDNDEHCTAGNVDQNCSALATDANCNTGTNPFTTLPDEKCGAGDVDQGCGHYDGDAACAVQNAGDPDNSCGNQVLGTTDYDENCGGGDADESCNMGYWPVGSADENCNVGGDTDDD